MATLTVNTPRSFDLGDKNDLPVVADDIIYQGAAVGDNASGYMRPLVAADPFVGFCLTIADNTGGAAGDINVEVLTAGKLQLSVTSVAITNLGDNVYASDDNAFTLVSTSNTLIGTVHRFISTGVCIVKFNV